jgi:hypothetical protein
MLLNELFEVSQDLAGRYKTAAIKDVDRAIAAKSAGTMGRDEYERKMTKRGRGTAAAQRRLTPQGTRLDLTPYGDAIQRDYDRYRTDEQGAAEGYQFKGPFPFDVDHMHGGRGINLPKAETKKYFTDKKQWQRAVDDINNSKYDDNSDYIGVTGRSTVEINGREWARWSDAQQKGYIELSSMSEQGVAEAGNKPLEKSRFGTGDTRTPRDIKSQMSGASDEFVRSTADKTTGPFHSKVAKMQGKLAKSELRKREQGVAEGEKSTHTSALGKALYRDLSKEKKASPQQVQRNKERWAQRQADREQGVAEGRTK